MYYKRLYRTSYDNSENSHEYRDTVISALFSPIRVIGNLIPVLMVLRFCGVISTSWWMLAGVMIGYELIDCLSDILQIAISNRDLRKREERWKEKCREKAVRMMERQEEEV